MCRNLEIGDLLESLGKTSGRGKCLASFPLLFSFSLFSLPLLRPRSLGIATPPVSSLLYILRFVFFCFPTSTVLSSFTSPEKVADTQVQSQTHMHGSDSARIRTQWYPNTLRVHRQINATTGSSAEQVMRNKLSVRGSLANSHGGHIDLP